MTQQTQTAFRMFPLDAQISPQSVPQNKLRLPTWFKRAKREQKFPLHQKHTRQVGQRLYFGWFGGVQLYFREDKP
ncbi:MAG: hypothetical protein KME35_09305 [Aphanocapsa sp. GSE-SYN-MK-11-07L]|jgi:hypothetical protein|nr:hypothetical protein [Aphanocapsa sp. GSE-SYN-MK-11-07L]